MDTKIGLSISCFNGVDFNFLLNIAWPGEKPSHFNADSRIVSDYIYSVSTGSEYDTYEIDLCHVLTPNPREYGMRIALRIPAATELVKDGRTVSPFEILNTVFEKIKKESLNYYGGKYEYPDYKIPVFDTDAYAAILAPYSVRPVWGRKVVMNGTETAFISMAGMDMNRLLLALPACARLASFKEVYIGDFSVNTRLLALTDEEISPKPSIEVRVNNYSGTSKNFPLTAPHTFASGEFGFDPRVFERTEVKLIPDEIIEAALRGETSLDYPGATVRLMRRDGLVTVSFNPPERVQSYDIVINKAGKNEGAVAASLRYDNNPIDNRKLLFRGENIVRFEDMRDVSPAFSLSEESGFKIARVDVQNRQIIIEVEALKKPEPQQPLERNTNTFSGNAAARSDRSATLVIDIDDRLLKSPMPVKIVQKSGYGTLCTPASISSSRKEFSFTVLQGAAGIEVLLGSPYIYKAEADYDKKSNVYTVNFYKAKKRSFFSRLLDDEESSWSGIYGIVKGLIIIVILLGFFLLGAAVAYRCHNEIYSALTDETTVQQTMQTPESHDLKNVVEQTPANPADTVTAQSALTDTVPGGVAEAKSEKEPK